VRPARHYEPAPAKSLCRGDGQPPAYTESGEQFRIPTLLANRADVYNLRRRCSHEGDCVRGLSFLETALTSNPTLGPLATRMLGDVTRLIRNGAPARRVPPSELSVTAIRAPNSASMLAVIRHPVHRQDSAAPVQTRSTSARPDAVRRSAPEPPFKLQGSYRNMNKIAEKVVRR